MKKGHSRSLEGDPGLAEPEWGAIALELTQDSEGTLDWREMEEQ